jgi:hypothetical protein
MDVYTSLRLYHRILKQWWKEDEQRCEIMIPLQTIPIESVLLALFKTFPTNKILLLSSDGKIHVLNHIDEPIPKTFKARRSMKIDNKTSVASIKNVMNVLYQLLSIDIEDQKISLMDWIGLVQFIISLMNEQHIPHCELFTYFQQAIFKGSDEFDPTRWKKIRDEILACFFDTNELEVKESMLQRLNSLYPLIEKLSKMIDFQNERIEYLESKLGILD